MKRTFIIPYQMPCYVKWYWWSLHTWYLKYSTGCCLVCPALFWLCLCNHVCMSACLPWSKTLSFVSKQNVQPETDGSIILLQIPLWEPVSPRHGQAYCTGLTLPFTRHSCIRWCCRLYSLWWLSAFQHDVTTGTTFSGKIGDKAT